MRSWWYSYAVWMGAYRGSGLRSGWSSRRQNLSFCLRKNYSVRNWRLWIGRHNLSTSQNPSLGMLCSLPQSAREMLLCFLTIHQKKRFKSYMHLRIWEMLGISHQELYNFCMGHLCHRRRRVWFCAWPSKIECIILESNSPQLIW